jgi:hypothetical protein
VDLARVRGLRNTTPTERFFKGQWKLRAVLRAIAGRTWDMLKADAAHMRRRPGL